MNTKKILWLKEINIVRLYDITCDGSEPVVEVVVLGTPVKELVREAVNQLEMFCGKCFNATEQCTVLQPSM